MIKKFLLVSILVIGLFTRFYKLSNYPPSPNWDEISHTYNAYSLLETGKDQWNQSWPIFNFRAYGDYPTTLNMYLTMPFVKILGINTLAGRLPTAILSFLTIPLVYFITKRLYPQKYFALITTFIFTISPWTIFSSRHSLQAGIAQFFLILGIALAVKNHLSLGLFFWALSAYGYHNTRIIIIPLLISFLLIYKIKLKKIIIPLLIFALLATPVTLSLISPESRARTSWVFILNQPALNTINQNRGLLLAKNYNPIIARLLSNKVTYIIPRLITNYLNFLNPQYLFFKGSQNYQLNIPGTGQYFWIYLPFYYLGIYHCLKNIKNKNNQFILAWFVIGLIPSVITSGDFPVVRAISIIPTTFIFITQSLFVCLKRLSSTHKQITIISLVLISLIFVTSYWHKYTTGYVTDHADSWQYGYQQAIDFAKQNYQNYDHIFFTKKYGEPHEFVLFFWPWPPADYQNDPNKLWDFHADWYWLDAFDKFQFLNDWQILDTPIPPNTLLITSPNNYPNQAKIIKTIYYPNNQPVFEIVDYK